MTASELATTGLFLAQTTQRIAALRSEQRHEAAHRVALGARRLLDTINAAQAELGFSAELAFGPDFAAINAICEEITA